MTVVSEGVGRRRAGKGPYHFGRRTARGADLPKSVVANIKERAAVMGPLGLVDARSGRAQSMSAGAGRIGNPEGTGRHPGRVSLGAAEPALVAGIMGQN